MRWSAMNTPSPCASEPYRDCVWIIGRSGREECSTLSLDTIVNPAEATIGTMSGAVRTSLAEGVEAVRSR
jgi:hypothetical protein